MHFYFEFPFMQPVLELCSFQVSRFSLEVHLSVLEFLFEYAQTFMSWIFLKYSYLLVPPNLFTDSQNF